jgi:DnaJ-class molecular chaperone
MNKAAYEVLQLAHGADRKAVREAYYRLAKRYHPDRNLGDASAEEKFREINDAYAKVNQMIMEYCDLLGVSSSADGAEVRRAFYVVHERYDALSIGGDVIAKNKLIDAQKAYDFLNGAVDDTEVQTDDGW